MKLVFHRFRPWALFSVHILLLALWERQSCTGEAGCENPRYPMRDLLQNFGMGFPEITSIITMCLLVVTFYCNTCIGHPPSISRARRVFGCGRDPPPGP